MQTIIASAVQCLQLSGVYTMIHVRRTRMRNSIGSLFWTTLYHGNGGIPGVNHQQEVEETYYSFLEKILLFILCVSTFSFNQLWRNQRN